MLLVVGGGVCKEDEGWREAQECTELGDDMAAGTFCWGLCQRDGQRAFWVSPHYLKTGSAAGGRGERKFWSLFTSSEAGV